MRGIGPGGTLCLIALASGALLACKQTPPPTLAADRPECPHAWSTFFHPVTDGDSSTSGGGAGGRNANAWQVPAGASSAFLISRDVSDVPEFHDCQRLIVTSPLVNTASSGTPGSNLSWDYGEMAAVLIRDRLDSVLLARVGIEGNDSIGAAGLPAAEIISEGQYLPLGIQTGFNCLVLADSGAAWMVAMGKDHRGFRCDAITIGSQTKANATLLSVSIDPPERDVASVPPVTRWERDSLSGQQLIGIKCRPRAWCTVGPKGHHAMPARVFANGTLLPRVAGWFDEQYLADIVPGATTNANGGSPLRVTPVVGTIYPAEHLKDWTMTSGQKSVWTPVAYIALSGSLPRYETKFGLSITPHASNGVAALNRVSFCVGSRQGCGVPSRVLSCASVPEIWAEVTSPIPLSTGNRTTYLCVRYRPHSAVPGATHFDIPAVVRWRWKADDEGMWVRCPAGCCEVFAA